MTFGIGARIAPGAHPHHLSMRVRTGRFVFSEQARSIASQHSSSPGRLPCYQSRHSTLSNSMIESWWRVLKHQWLFLNALDSVRTVETLVAFYVQEHNSRLPHSAFRGQTPDEMYFVPERDMVSARTQMTPEQVTERINPRVTVSSVPGRDFPARIKEAATTADPTTRTFQVKLVFERPDDVTILPGMTARVVVHPDAGDDNVDGARPTRPGRMPTDKPFVWLLDPSSP